MARKRKPRKQVETLTHPEESRRNIPTSELESLVSEQDKSPLRIAYERRSRDQDPQLVWRGKDEQDWSDLVVQAPPLYIQEKVHPKVLIDDLLRESQARAQEDVPETSDLFADFEYLYDKPYEDKGKVRVAGPFTVESLTPHRTAEAASPPPASPEQTRHAHEVGIEDAPAKPYREAGSLDAPAYDFTAVILDQLRTAGVQQADKRHKIDFTSLSGWPGELICAEGRYNEGENERRAAILVGPEHGTVGRVDLFGAAREAAEAGFDALIACAFNYDAQSTDVARLGKLPILKARMNADLHMSADLKKTKAGNLFVIFGEPDIEVLAARGKSPAAFDRRCIPPGCVARRLNIPDIRAPRALPGGRLAGLCARATFATGC